MAGVPLVLRLAAVLREAGLEPALVARSPRGLGLPERLEPDGPRHPLWGVAAVLDEGDALFVPCDLVDLRADAVRALLAVGGPCVARGQPLLGVYPAALAGRARALALEGAPVRRFVEGLPEVDVGPLANLNRPA